jgi:hypothetical protein
MPSELETTVALFVPPQSRLRPEIARNLEAGLKTGQPQNEVSRSQKPMFDELYSDPARLEQFMSAMAGISVTPASLAWTTPAGVFVGPLPDRTCGYRTNIVPGSDPVVVHLPRGEPIRGRVKCSGPTDDMNVWADRDGARFEPRTNAAGEFLFPALPPGSYRISVVVNSGDPHVTAWKGSIDADAGSTVEIVVSK